MSSCSEQLLRTLLKSKRLDRESVVPEVGFLALVVRESFIYRRSISEAVLQGDNFIKDSVRDRAPIFRATRTKIFLIAAALVSQIGHLEFDTFPI